ncbi:DnaB-like helicase C-terminal domain-containing protein [Streptomyces sp. AK04-3B]|uniref:DnaB-like helicase C-terminal domain-containing protein n=1 Tax=Streptomyces sp. AK04-3B TaxID=3028650 RepID=UPI0029B93051|nr:DnaB-like helicase C-terminal domain-containing protein [Streptomyces sp. AK04-3B]MDX3801088.1 DnaB-like helicase C-terminal domain-containing protein [Streptomyces sp. AK04-3B]
MVVFSARWFAGGPGAVLGPSRFSCLEILMSAHSAVPDPSAAEPAAEGAGGAADPSAAAPMPVEELEVLGVTEARNRLYELVDAARDEGRMTVVVKRDGKTHRTYRAALIPVGRLDAASRARLVGWPSWARTAARPKLGDRVIDAAGRPGVPGVPQVLLDRTTPLAVLVDAALVPPGDALVAVPVGGAPAPPAPAAAWADAAHLQSGASAAPQAHEAAGKGLPAARQVFAAPEASVEPAVDVADAASADVSAAADLAVPPAGEGVAEAAVAASAGSGAAPVIAPLAVAGRTADLQGAGPDSVGPDAAVAGRDAGAEPAGHAAAEEAVGGRDTVAGRGADGTAPSAGTDEIPPLVPSAGGGVRRLHGLGEVAGLVLTEAVASPAVPRFGFGLGALDAALGSLPSGVLTVVAAEPHAGGSLLAVHAARHTALTHRLPVLYAASGLSRTDVAMRVIAAEGELDYRRLRTGSLTPDEQQAAAQVQARLTAADLHVDDGTGLTAEAIAETAPYVEGLALVVVDRFQHAADPFIPLSGPALPEAARVLAHLARTRNVPVVAVLDTADPDALAALDVAHVTLTLTRTGNDAQVTVAERDFGELTTVVLRADVACARFTDAPARPRDPKAAHAFGSGKDEKATVGPATEAAPGVALQPGPGLAVSVAVGEGFAAVEAELLDAALPFISGARSGLSARLAGALAALREVSAAPAREGELPGLRQALDGLAARRPPVPATPEGERLGAALAAFTAAHRDTPTSAPIPAPPSPVPATGTPEAGPVPAGPMADAVAAGAAPGAVEDVRAADPARRVVEGVVMEAPSASFSDDTPPPEGTPGTGGRNYTFFLNKIRDAVEQALGEADGDVDAAIAALKKKAVPDSMALFKLTRVGANYVHTVYPPALDFLSKPGQGEADGVWEGRQKWRNAPLYEALRKGERDALDVFGLDINAAYLSAFKTHLPIGALKHDPTGGFDRRKAGIHRVDHFTWPHADLPSPIGNRIEPGPYLLDEATVRLLIRCSELGLSEPPRILESWTSGASEALLEKFRRVLQQARQTAIDTGDPVTGEYVKAMYSRFTSTIGESGKNRELRRPEWVHTIRSQAFASLWLRGWKAHQAGLILVQVSGVDELHVAGGDWKKVWEEGRKPAQMKVKRFYTLGGN